MKTLLLVTILTLGFGAELFACGCGIVRRTTPVRPVTVVR